MFRSVLVAAMLATSLAACGSGGGAAIAPAATQTAQTPMAGENTNIPAGFGDNLPFVTVSPVSYQYPAVGVAFTLASPIPVYSVGVKDDQAPVQVGTIANGVGAAETQPGATGTLGITIVNGNASVPCSDNGEDFPINANAAVSLANEQLEMSYILCLGNPF